MYVKKVLEKAEEPEIKLPTFTGSSKKQESSRKKHLFLLYWLANAFDCVDHNKLRKIFKEVETPDHLTCPLETCMQIKKKQLELDMEQWTGSKLRKEHIKAVYCHPAKLDYIQSTSSEMTDWMKYKPESRLPGGNINDLRLADGTTLMAES